MMVAFAMVATMVSCSKDKDDDENKVTYTASAEITDEGDLGENAAFLNQALQGALQDAKYEDVSLEDAKKDLNTRLSAQAQQIASNFSDYTFEVTVYLKDASGNKKAEWIVYCDEGEVEID